MESRLEVKMDMRVQLGHGGGVCLKSQIGGSGSFHQCRLVILLCFRELFPIAIRMLHQKAVVGRLKRLLKGCWKKICEK